MKNARFLFLLIPFFLACTKSLDKPTLKHNPRFKKKFNYTTDKKEKVTTNGFNYVVSKIDDNTFVYRQFYAGTQQMTQYYIYNSKDLQIKEGFSRTWWDNGKLRSEGLYMNDNKEGVWNYFFDNGNISNRGEYRNNKKSGIWEYFHRNGTLKNKTNYVDNVANGEIVAYDKNGSKVSTTLYKMGEIESLNFEKNDSIAKQLNLFEQPAIFGTCPSEGEINDLTQCSAIEMEFFIKDNLQLPAEVKKHNIKGKATFHFYIDKNGKSSIISCISCLTPAIKKECERLVQSFPKWHPAIQEGKAVGMDMVLGIDIE